MSEKSISHPNVPTKTSAPRLFGGCIPRTVLIKELTAGLDRRVTLIQAGAGYGKSTLAVQFQQQLTVPCAWLSADTTDNDLYQFLRYLVNSVRVVLPEACANLLDLIRSPQEVAVARLADAFVSDMAKQEEQFVLMVDDLHFITSESVHQFLVRVTQFLPKGLHMVFTSRTEPPWPLPLWRSRGWLCEMDSQHLSFSESESKAFLQATLEQVPDEKAIASLHQQSEGWPAGLRLMQLSAQNRKDPEDVVREFKGDNQEIARYLASELLDNLPTELVDFLERTAPLDRFCAELCDVVMGGDSAATDLKGSESSRQSIEELLRRSLFLVPLDQDGHWYRYHHLFQKLILQRLLRKSKDAERAVQRCAGHWFESQGSTEDALAYLLKAGDVDEATRVFWTALPSILQADLSRRELARLWAMFPQLARVDRAELLIAEAFLKMVRLDLDGLAGTLQRAEALLREMSASPRVSEMRAMLNASNSFSSYWNGDGADAWQRGTDALANLPSRCRVSRNYATLYAAGGLMISGKTNQALAFINKAIHKDASKGSTETGALLVCKAFLHLTAADFDGVAACTHRLKQLHQMCSVPDYWYGYTDYFRGITAYERNHLDDAAEAFTAVSQFEFKLHSRHFHSALVLLAHTKLASEDLSAARRIADQAREHAISACDPTSARVSDALEAMLLSARQQNLANSFPRPGMNDAVSIYPDAPTLTYAELLVHANDENGLPVARDYIEAALHLASQNCNQRQVIVLMLLKSLLLDRVNEEDSAFELLGQCLRFGQKCGLTRTFVDRGPQLADLLRRVPLDGSLDSYRAQLLTCFSGKARLDTAGPLLPEPKSTERARVELSMLSFREQDVLALMQQGLSNKQIAAHLEIAAETVKKHAQSIYRKLGVKTRRQAVVQAEHIGLLRRRQSSI